MISYGMVSHILAIETIEFELAGSELMATIGDPTVTPMVSVMSMLQAFMLIRPIIGHGQLPDPTRTVPLLESRRSSPSK